MELSLGLVGFRSSKWYILVAACVALYTTSFYYTSTVLLIPFTMTKQAGVSEDGVQIYAGVMIACYSVILVIGGPLAGYWADVGDSKKRPIMVAQAFLLVSTVILWKGTHVAVLIAGRLCHGVAGSIFWSAGQALLADTFGAESIGNAVGYVDLSSSLGYLLAPILTGVLLDKSGVDSVYAMSLGFACISFLISAAMIEGGNESRQHRDSTVPDLSATLMGRLRLARFLLGSRRMLAACLGCFVAGLVLVTYDAIAPVHMERTYHWGPWEVGLALGAWYGPKTLSIIPGTLADRFGARWMSVVGFVGCIPCFVAVAFATDDTSRSKALFILMTVCLSIAISFANTPITAEIIYVLDDKRRANPALFGATRASGLGFGFFLFSWALGATIGSLTCAKIVDSVSWDAAVYSLAGWCAAGAVICLIWTGAREKSSNTKMVNMENSEAGESREKIICPKLDLGDLGDDPVCWSLEEVQMPRAAWRRSIYRQFI
ncbi:major facilitator superfamily domain-containing protein [Cercophora newfieldiana]|uniref:Major facilitator superfamily domain-containing protein n=1 Tax=Cercophora newfieldiana TaxID=92897 RepID=A0AA39Y1F5_9PEZI|nr:major facilitator superfamily domain-containing protein [Cercophora newfieldiana]